ncbi:hypothetical protein [Vibrio phage vB_VibM_10AMN]|uniref:Uncharacterized protein n=1 Tax=Staphylococcus phage vB_VibM_10AMN12 TaxID=3076785 RepID=A0AA96KSP9_9CAUD|nr:hypothetical protein [Vibrio phage vB_VibM_10AMN]WNO47539.1 hypothetical protein [Staphylococcus phage vB_VibM_10AMN12]
MKHYFVKGQDGNWFNEKTKYYLGTDEDFLVGHIEAEGWSVREIVDHIMQSVNDALEED